MTTVVSKLLKMQVENLDFCASKPQPQARKKFLY